MKRSPICLAFVVLFALFSSIYSQKWAIEFEGDWNEASVRAESFATSQGLQFHGRVGQLNVFEFEMPSMAASSHKRSELNALASTLRVLEMQNAWPAPKHPIADLQTMYEASEYVYYRSQYLSSKRSVEQSQNSFGITWVEEQIDRRMEKRNVTVSFTDPLYAQQYHLHPRTDALATLNAEVAWNEGFTGEGVTIAIVDDGLQHIHPDMQSNYRPAGSYNFDQRHSDPSPTNLYNDYHGTCSAGVAAARDDGSMCGVGVAYRAGLSGLAILQSDALNDAKESSALQYALNVNHIFSNSWGPPDGGVAFVAPGPLVKQAIENGIRTGRNGKGSIYVWAGGNGGSKDNCNYDGYASSRYAVTVGAVDSRGRKSVFSEECASLLVMAPSASDASSFIVTTDLMGSGGRTPENCNMRFSGTSAACPAIAGVVALILQANPALTWIDVQRVLIETAVKTDPASPSWSRNGAGYWISHFYGFGLADSAAAVRRAVELKTVPSMDRQVLLSYQMLAPQPLVSSGNLHTLSLTFTVTENIVIQHVELVFDDMFCRDAADLSITLTSPSGTESVLAKSHGDNSGNLRNWKFTSRRLWGETASGTWRFVMTDINPGSILRSHSLRIWGSPNANTQSNVYKESQGGDVYVPRHGTPESTRPSTPPSPPMNTPLSIPSFQPLDSQAPTTLKHNSTQTVVIFVSIVAGVAVVAGLVFGIFWYWRSNNKLDQYDHLGGFSMTELESDGLVAESDLGLSEEEGAGESES